MEDWMMLRFGLWSLTAYEPLGRLPVLTAAKELLEQLAVPAAPKELLSAWGRLFCALREEGQQDLTGYLWEQLAYADLPHIRTLEQPGADPALEAAARRDVETLSKLAAVPHATWLLAMQKALGEEYAPATLALPSFTGEEGFAFEDLLARYRSCGAGPFARDRAFLWQNGRLSPVRELALGEELIGYELQRSRVEANTRALLAGKRVNNILLYGDSGTGKSATVKAMLSVPGFDDLRIIEVRKEQLGDMLALIRTLADRRQKFILFIDDLAFDQDDKSYSVLKTILEGGLEERPQNVAVYATSNRRHLVKQNFSDRRGDEVDANETIQEKTSLSERFGIRIAYLGLNRPDFQKLALSLARRAGLDMEEEQLKAESLKWEMHHPGRTPRTARQFVADLERRRQEG